MSGKSTIKFTRGNSVEESYDVALIRLNTFSHVIGQPVVVRYLDNREKIRSIVAVGVKNGVGTENYTIVSNGAIEPITGAYDYRLPDVASLVNGEVYLCYDPDGTPSYCTEQNNVKSYEPITEDRTFYSAMDGFLWFVTNGRIKRSDQSIDKNTIQEEVQKIIDNGQLEIKNARTVYEWNDADGIVTGNEEYAKVFSIPGRSSVVMAVTSFGPFGTVDSNIIIYSNSGVKPIYNLVSNDSFLFEAGNNGTVVRKSVPSGQRYLARHEFILISSTCSEDEIVWYKNEGYTGKAEKFLPFGKNSVAVDKSDYVTLNYIYHVFGKSYYSANLIGTKKNILANTYYSENRKITTFISDIPENEVSYKFLISHNIKGFVLEESTKAGSNTLLDIDREIFANSELTISRFKANEWTYSITEPAAFSSDGSISIVTTSDGRNDFTISRNTFDREFVYAASETEEDLEKHGYAWTKILNITKPNEDDILEGAISTFEFKCKRYEISSILGLTLKDGGSILVIGEEPRNIQSHFAFALVDTGESYGLWFRPRFGNGTHVTEFNLLSSALDCKYASKGYYQGDHDYVTSRLDFPELSNLYGGHTSQIMKGSSQVITSGAVWSEFEDVNSKFKETEKEIERLRELFESLSNDGCGVIKFNDTVIKLPQDIEMPEQGEVRKGIDLGVIYTPENTRTLTSPETIESELVPVGSLIYEGPNNEKKVLAYSTDVKTYQFTPTSPKWWWLGNIDSSNKSAMIQVKMKGIYVGETIGGYIYWIGENLVTTNYKLIGYIKRLGNSFFVRGGFPDNVATTYTITSYNDSFTLGGREDPNRFGDGDWYYGYGANLESLAEVESDVKVPDRKELFLNGNNSNKIDVPFNNFRLFISNVPKTGTIPEINIYSTGYDLGRPIMFDYIFLDNSINLAYRKLLKITIREGGNPTGKVFFTNTTENTTPGMIYTATYNPYGNVSNNHRNEIYISSRKSNLKLGHGDIGVTVEGIVNKTQVVGPESTEEQYPSAKAVWEAIKDGVESNDDVIKVTCQYDNFNKFNKQGAIVVENTPAKFDVHWSVFGEGMSETLYVAGNPTRENTVSLRSHNSITTFSYVIVNNKIVICIPAKISSSYYAPSITYNFIPGKIGKISQAEEVNFYESANPADFVGKEIKYAQGAIYNMKTSGTISDFDFKKYDSILITYPDTNISIKNTSSASLPSTDKIFTIVNNTGKTISNLYVEGKNSTGAQAKVNIDNIQPGAAITLTYASESNSFVYEITLQEFYSPDRSIDIVKEDTKQWSFKLSDSVNAKLNAAIQDIDAYTKAETDERIKVETDRATARETELGRLIGTETNTRQTDITRVEGLITNLDTKTETHFTTVENTIESKLQEAKEYTDSSVASALKWKGVKNWAELQNLTEMKVGDVYTVSDKDNGEYAWTGKEWEFIGVVADYSALQTQINKNKSDISAEVTRASQKESELKTYLDTKANINSVYTKQEVDAKFQYITDDMINNELI